MLKDRLGQWTYGEPAGENVIHNQARGLDHLRDSQLNKVKLCLYNGHS